MGLMPQWSEVLWRVRAGGLRPGQSIRVRVVELGAEFLGTITFVADDTVGVKMPKEYWDKLYPKRPIRLWLDPPLWPRDPAHGDARKSKASWSRGHVQRRFDAPMCLR